MDDKVLSEMVAFVARQVSGKRSGRPIAVSGGSNNPMRGASGVDHQVDMVIASDRFVVLLDLSAWPLAITKSGILERYARLMDVAIAQDEAGKMVDAVVVSGRGISADVEKLVRYWRATLLTPNSTDEIGPAILDRVSVTERMYN